MYFPQISGTFSYMGNGAAGALQECTIGSSGAVPKKTVILQVMQALAFFVLNVKDVVWDCVFLEDFSPSNSCGNIPGLCSVKCG